MGEMKKPTRREALVGGISLAITITVGVLIIEHRDFVDQMARWGYVGAFLINIAAAGTFLLPGFSAVLSFTLGGVLNPAIVGAVAGAGEAIGASGVYFMGYGGGGLFGDRNSRMYSRFSNAVERHGSKAVFVLATLITPFYYPFAMFMGMIRFGWVRFFLATLAGRTIKNMILAYLGHFGLGALLNWLGLNL